MLFIYLCYYMGKLGPYIDLYSRALAKRQLKLVM